MHAGACCAHMSLGSKLNLNHEVTHRVNLLAKFFEATKDSALLPLISSAQLVWGLLVHVVMFTYDRT